MYDSQCGKMYKCRCCGKEFWCSYRDNWTYKTESKMFCSYTCFRKDQRAREAKHKPLHKYAKSVS